MQSTRRELQTVHKLAPPTCLKFIQCTHCECTIYRCNTFRCTPSIQCFYLLIVSSIHERHSLALARRTLVKCSFPFSQSFNLNEAINNDKHPLLFGIRYCSCCICCIQHSAGFFIKKRANEKVQKWKCKPSDPNQRATTALCCFL